MTDAKKQVVKDIRHRWLGDNAQPEFELMSSDFRFLLILVEDQDRRMESKARWAMKLNAKLNQAIDCLRRCPLDEKNSAEWYEWLKTRNNLI